ncbi:PLP-dependent aminotransferase family protein [Pelosinus baikalensis]|nr:PLP-dependent aminotransferase family protein [Pelosinus baikalensis]
MVKEYIFSEVEAGKIKEGNHLPSCREVALKLSINKITVNKAYRELESEHKVFSIPRGGFYLVDSGAKRLIIHKKIDYMAIKPEEKLIPYREFTHVINKAVDLYKDSLFEYEPTAGLVTLRETFNNILQKDGIYTTADRIVITHGAQQAISLVFQAVFPKNKGKLLLEVPTYGLALEFANYLGIDIIGIERKRNGFDYNELELLFRRGDIRAFYVIPRHHNPTGYTLSENHKEKIANLSSRYNVLVIEDDYLADVGDKRGSMPIHYYDIRKSTVYIRSFSKTFMPGIRMGAAVLPESMIESVTKLKKLSDLNTSRLPQAALDIFIKSGMYEKQIKKVRKSYEAKLRKAKEILSSLSPEELIWHVPEHGIFIWMQLPEYINMTALEIKLEKQGIIIKSAREFFLMKELVQECSSSRDLNYLRLCISSISEKDIESIATIISAIRSFDER